MKKVLVACVVLLVLHVLNPDLEAHRSAFMLRLDRDQNEAFEEGGFLTKLGLVLGGDEIKASLLNSLRRRDYVLFSVCYFDGKMVTIGALGYVHLCE